MKIKQMKNNLFKISQAARFLSITPTTLRYYESEGLLTPAFIDPITKYRYYDIANINTVSYILELRDVGSTMIEIKSYLKNQANLTNLLDKLTQQQTKLQKKIDFFQEIYTSSQKNNTVSKTTIPAVKYISQDYIAKDFLDTFNLVENFLSDIVPKTTLTASPVTFIEYDTLDFSITNFKISIGIEVENSTNQINLRPSQEVIKTIHHGSYETLPQAYSKLIKYAKDNQIQLNGNVYEYYYESLNLRSDPNDYVTAVIMPLKQI